jgi:bla regulator protein blaR1
MTPTSIPVKVAIFKRIALLTLLISVLYLLSIVSAVARQKKQTESSLKDASTAILKEYTTILSKYNLTNEKGKKDFQSKITKADRVQLETLYKKMSRRQQSKQVVGFMPNVPPPPEVVPTDKQLEEWENTEMYGVWIDGKKVSNPILKDYSNTDFSQARISKSSKKDKSYYKVDLMTKGYYQETFSNQIASKGRSIMFVR